MLIFLDTEFTDFVSPQLISIGLATDGDNHFYAELNDFDVRRCSSFVKETVLPQLGKHSDKIMGTRQLRKRMTKWLQQFTSHNPVICYDYDGDWDLFLQVMADDVPSWLTNENIYGKINDLVLERFFMDSGLTNHHALHDAIANRFAYRSAPHVEI